MTEKVEISSWFDVGVKKKQAYLIVVCDTYEHEDYPIFAATDEYAKKLYAEHNGVNMQRVMEVYDLRQDKQTQLNEHRAFHLPT